jgi:hypothetical protein
MRNYPMLMKQVDLRNNFLKLAAKLFNVSSNGADHE